MHFSVSTTTIPSSRCLVAPVGHCFSHSGFPQCMQVTGRNPNLLFGYFPTSNLWTRLKRTPFEVAFSARHATVHVSHPMHLFRSITIPYFGLFLGIFLSLELSDLHPGTHVNRSAERIHAHVILCGHQDVEGRAFLGDGIHMDCSSSVACRDANHFRVNEFGQL